MDWNRPFRAAQFKELVGQTIKRIEKTENERENEEISFYTAQDEEYLMFHTQSCCEEVAITDIAGDLENLIDSPVLFAEESSNSHEEPIDSRTWTFNRIGTIKGAVVISWLGTSNGYYSEDVDIYCFSSQEKRILK